MIIGIFGVELCSINYGCAALGISQLKIIEKLKNKKNLKIEYYIFSNDDINSVDELKKFLKIESDVIIKGLINFKDGIRGWKNISNEIKKCDIVIDLTYGDSFSDIYGFKNYILYTIPKIITLHNKKKLILAPQTIGPYKDFLVRVISKQILKNAEVLCVRDKKSFALAKKLSGRDDIILTSDLAMELPYQNNSFSNEKFRIGINISDLLWKNTNEDNMSKYGIIVDYKELIKKIIEYLQNGRNEIHLITHVFSKNDNEGEYYLAQKIHKDYPDTVLAPKFNNPIEAKSYISGLNLFMGSRMHATIGAFSAGVPVIPISYSMKFEGLYGSLNYNYGINLTIENAIRHIGSCIENYGKMEEDREKALEEAINLNNKYYRLLLNYLEKE